MDNYDYNQKQNNNDNNNQNKNGGNGKFLIILIAVVVLLVMIFSGSRLWSSLTSQFSEEVSYDTFVEYVEKGEVTDVSSMTALSGSSS